MCIAERSSRIRPTGRQATRSRHSVEELIFQTEFVQLLVSFAWLSPLSLLIQLLHPLKSGTAARDASRWGRLLRGCLPSSYIPQLLLSRLLNDGDTNRVRHVPKQFGVLGRQTKVCQVLDPPRKSSSCEYVDSAVRLTFPEYTSSSGE